MSLRRKIIGLFVLFAVLPLLALAGVSYWQARVLLVGLVHEQVLESARSAASDLSTKVDLIESSLRGNVGEPQSFSPGGLPGPAAESDADSPLARAVYVGTRSPEGVLTPVAGSLPRGMARCADGITDRFVTFSTPISADPTLGSAEAGFWVSDLVQVPLVKQDQPFLQVVARDGSVLLGMECVPDADAPLSLREPEVGPGLPAFAGPSLDDNRTELDDWEWSVAPVGGTGWDLVAFASIPDALSPLRQLTLIYWVFVLGLSVFTAVAFSLMLRRFTRSLSDLVHAAEEIGAGELDPWLPLAAPGELGQLTMAFSRMLGRVRETMNQVGQSGRLAVIGQMSAYLAHEIRNPLSSIKMNLQRLLRWTKAGRLPESCLEPLEISLKEVERLNASVTGVLQMSRAGEGPKEVVGLHDVLGEATELLASRFEMQGVDLDLELDADVDFVLARPGQLKSVALNLMMNALEAQPGGGQLSIRTGLVGSLEIGGPAISIRFQDQGPGVPFGLRERIFEPFFTAKEGGSGIGLAMAKQAVEDSGGRLFLAPSVPPEAGAEFVMVFPLASFDAGRQGTSPSGKRYSTIQARPAPIHYHLEQQALGPDELPPGDAGEPLGVEAASSLLAPKSEPVN